MNKKLLKQLIKIMSTADGGCPKCVKNLLEKLHTLTDLSQKDFIELCKKELKGDVYWDEDEFDDLFYY